MDRRHRRTRRDAATVMIPLLGVWTVGLSLMLFVAALDGAHSNELLTDPSFNVGVRWYTGLVSNIGVLGWTVGVAAAFGAAGICRLGARHRAAHFLFGGGLVSSMLLLDDLLHLHAIALPAAMGIPGPLVVAVMCAVVFAWLGRHLGEFRRTTVHLMVAAGIAFAVSGLVEHFASPVPGQGWKIVGDGAELLAIMAWATYFVVTARDLCRSTFVDALLATPPEMTSSPDNEISRSVAL